MVPDHKALLESASNPVNGPAGAEESSRPGTGPAGFEYVLENCRERVLAIARRMTGRREDARDISQEVFLRLFKTWHRLDPERDPLPWICRMTINACRDHYRRQRPGLWQRLSGEMAEWLPARPASPDQELEQLDRQAQLARALEQLPFKERSAVVLRDIEGLPVDEVARILGIAEVTVRSHLSRGRLRLQKICTRPVRRNP